MAVSLRRFDPSHVGRALSRVPVGVVMGVIEATAVILLGVFIIQIIWGALTPAPNLGAGIAAPDVVAAKRAQITYRDLTYDPFHRAAPAAAEEKVDLDAPETALNLKLYGVRAVEDPKAGSAIIGLPNGSQGAFAVGMEVMSGVSLAAVLPTHVVFARGGAMESLYLDEDAKRRASAQRNMPRQDVTAETAAPAAPVAVSASNAIAESRGTSEQTIANMLQSGAIRARMDGASLAGLEVSDGEGYDALLSKIGLIDGDVIVAVDATRLDNLQKINLLKDRLISAESASLTVEREGAEQVIEIDLAALRQ